MKLPSVIIIYILILYENPVYSNTTEYIQSVITTINEGYETVESSQSFINEDSISSIDDIIRLDNPYVTTNIKLPNSKQYVYKLNGVNKSILTHPNDIIKIKFGDYIMEFDDNARLPSYDVDYIYLYTCEHNHPVLIHLYSESKIYIYSLNSKTNKWTNYTLRYDERFIRDTDENGIDYYNYTSSCLRNLFLRHFENYKNEEKELIKELCTNDTCLNTNRNNDFILEIYTKLSKIFIPRNIYCDFIISTPLTLKLKYEIDLSHKNTLKYPNEIESIKFAGNIMEFDDNAKLPCFRVDYIYIYSCMHFSPVLLAMYNNSKLYYYSLDRNTNKWTNYTLRYDERFKEYSDDNEILYYEKLIPDDTSIEIYDDPIKLVEELCNDDNCLSGNTMSDAFMEIKMK